MLWQLVKSVVLFWFSSVSLIFIAMIILFVVSYFYDCYVWSTTPPAFRTPTPVLINRTSPGAFVLTNSRGEHFPTQTSKKGAKWKKTSKKSSDKREKEIHSTDYESSSESLAILNHHRKIDEFLALAKHMSRGSHLENISDAAIDDEMFSFVNQRRHINYEDSDESFSETEKFRVADRRTEETYSLSSCIPLSTPPPKSGQCLKRSITSHTKEKYKEIAPNPGTKGVSSFSPSPFIALTGPGPGSFVANRAEPIITPSAYIDPPIYGSIMPVFHVGKLSPKSSCTENQTASKDKVDGVTHEEGV